jgi:hypothetical protein
VELAFPAGGTFEILRWVLSWGEAAEVAPGRAASRGGADAEERERDVSGSSAGDDERRPSLDPAWRDERVATWVDGSTWTMSG